MAVPGWGEYFTKVYLLRPKIKCNSPHSRPETLRVELRKRVSRPSGQTPRRRQAQGNADQERERASRDCHDTHFELAVTGLAPVLAAHIPATDSDMLMFFIAYIALTFVFQP